MFNNASNTKGFKKNTSNKKWITEEKIKKLFPRGYRKCDFFSSPVEFCTMSKEECLNWKPTAILDLNDKLDLPKNLQEVSYIGHSSDTELFMHLLNLDINVEKMANDALVNINSNIKKCYTCNNVCKCSGLRSNRLKNSFRNNNYDTVSLLSKKQLVVPEIQSINKFDKFSIKGLPNYILNNNDISVTFVPEPNISENRSDIYENGHDNERNQMNEQIFCDNIPLSQVTPNDIQSSPLDYRVVTDRTAGQVIQDESNFNENNAYYENVLKYFHLNSISDVFQNLQDDSMITY